MDIALRGSGGRDSRVRFAPLSDLVSEIDIGRTVLVTDPEIARLHGAGFPPCPLALVPRGEAAKSLAGLEGLYGRFLELGLGRDGTVLAIGGGSVSDLAGFAASTWLRGVDFGFAPTTLLAMVDASVGGKNGVDFGGYKNLVGSFRQPRFVSMDVSLIASLSDQEYASGMAEAIKCAVLAGEPYFSRLEAACASGRRALGAELESLIAPAVELKAAIVGRDEREAGERRLLNLGHTLGHAVEAATGIPHGHAVAAGLAAICRWSATGDCTGAAAGDGATRPAAQSAAGGADALDGPSLRRILALLGSCGLPSSLAEAAELWRSRGGKGDGPEFREAVAAGLAADKKRSGAEILIVVPRALGDCAIVGVPVGEIAKIARSCP